MRVKVETEMLAECTIEKKGQNKTKHFHLALNAN